MTRRVTISLSQDEYQKAQYFAGRLNITLPTYLSLLAAGGIEADIEAERFERDLAETLNAHMLYNIPTSGNA